MKIIITAKPRSKKTQVIQIDATHFKVFVKEPPTGGKANDAIIEALAEYWEIPKSRIQIVSGHTSKNKVIEIA